MRLISSRTLVELVLVGAAVPFCAQVPLCAQDVPSRANSISRQRAPKPYTAEFKITTVQTLANGTTITRESTEIVARDSQGRVMHSTTQETPGPGQAPFASANANDPVEGTQSNWNSHTKQARVTRLPPQDQRKGCWANDSGNFRASWNEGPKPGAPAPNGTVLADGSTIVPAQRHTPEIEDLGTSTIQGYEVQGHRLTTTIPAGEIGNDQPIVTVSETWIARQLGLGLVLREITDDPRTGKRTRELVNLTLGDPDPSVFQPPDGYEVITDELHQVTCPAPR